MLKAIKRLQNGILLKGRLSFLKFDPVLIDHMEHDAEAIQNKSLVFASSYLYSCISLTKERTTQLFYINSVPNKNGNDVNQEEATEENCKPFKSL